MRTPNKLTESALAYSILKSTETPACVAQIVSELDKEIEASYGRVRYSVKRMGREGLLKCLGNNIADDARLVFYVQTPKTTWVFIKHREMMRRLLKKRIPC